jgi:hypothetical protein
VIYKTLGNIIYEQRNVEEIRIVCMEIKAYVLKIMGVEEEMRKKGDGRRGEEV